jgi:hypothetical protein
MDPRPLIDSRKFKALALAAALIGLPIVGVAVALVMGKATFDQFVALTQVAFASLAGVAAVFIGAVAHEDAAAKSNAPITAAGNVTVTNTTPPPGGGTGGPPAVTVEKTLPPPPRVPSPFGSESLAPVSRRSVVPLSLTALAVAAAVVGCTGVFKQDARTALDVEQAACVLANIALDVPALRTICRISDALDPELEKLLAAGRKVAAQKGAPVCRAAGAP